MDKSKILLNYEALFSDLINMIKSTEKYMLNNDANNYFSDNANFFSKSFIVISCAYLESYLKDILYLLIEEFNKKISQCKIPFNIVKWSVDKKDTIKNNNNDELFKINITKDDIDDNISGNIFKTIDCFKRFGIDLTKHKEISEVKDKIFSIVTKRNNIVHYNDSASDISLKDMIDNINTLIFYVNFIDKETLRKLN